MQELDKTMPCLFCNQIVALSSKILEKLKVPVAFCEQCHSAVKKMPDGGIFIIQGFLLLRSQVAALFERVEKAEVSIEKTFVLVRDLEEAMVSESGGE